MSTFTKNSVTLKGAVAIAALMAGGTLEFTRIAVGDGNIPEGQTALTMTDLSHHLFDVDINEVYSDSESQATVIGIFNNSQTETGFYYRELGLFAKDPATGAEILFCYGNAGDEAEWISPAGSESVIEKEVHIVTLVGNATEVKATLKSGIYLTQEQAKLKADLDATAAEGGRVVPEQMRFDEIQDIYVDAAATAEGADGSEAKPFKTFAAALNAFYPGARVVRINVKAGTYDETVSVQNAPGTLFHFSRNGDGIVTIKTLSAIFTQIYMSDMTITGQTTEGNAVTLSNVGNFALQRVTVGGTNNTSGVACYNSKGFLESVTINGCGTAFEARDGSQVALRGCTGAGNVVGVAAFESVVTLAEHTMTATTPYVTSNGGAINDSYGTSTFPSNFHPGYYLGNFTTMDALRQALLAEFQKLQSGSSRFVSFAGNIAGGIGEFAEGQMMNATITKTSESGSGYGYVIFHAHNGPIFGYMQIGEGAFKTQTPISLAKWQIINDTSANIGDLTTGIYTIQSGSNGTAGVPSAQNGTLIVDKNVGVPYQIYITDYENIMYKRIFADGAWQAWARFPGIATTEEYGLIRLASESDILQETDNKVMDVPLAYELNDFRRMNKTYAVGDKVNCAFRFEWFLECTKAGTTSGQTLDTRNVTFGQTITDGSVNWVVRAHVKSVNGIVPDANGNVSISIPQQVNADWNATNGKAQILNKPSLARVATSGSYNDLSNKPTILNESAIKTLILNTFFPVGSIYMDYSGSINPSSKFGGTWVKVENVFLLASGSKSVGATGGAENVTLTTEQIPSHNHGGKNNMNITGYFGSVVRGDDVESDNPTPIATGAFTDKGSINSKTYLATTTNEKYWRGTDFNAKNSWSGSSGNAGGGKSHTNMPPYRVVAVWRRTA